MSAALFQAVNFCVGVKIHGLYPPGPVEMINTLNFRATASAPDTADCTAVATFVQAWVHDTYAGFFQEAIHVTQIEAFSRAAPDGAEASIAVDIVGGMTNPLANIAAAPLVLLHTGVRGRSKNGRFYAFPPDSAAIGIGQYLTAFMVQWYTAFATLMTAAEGAGYPLVVASPVLNAVTNVTAVSYSPRLTMQTRRRLAFGR